MKRLMAVLSVMLVSALVMAQETKKDEVKKEEAKPQTKCAVMGGEINKSLYVDYEGKRIYMCCPGCLGALTKDPAKYVKKLESEGVTLARIQTTCPVTGEKLENKNVFADHNGKRVYFCCPACVESFKKEPDKYIKKFEDEGVTLDQTPAIPAKTDAKAAPAQAHDHATMK